MAQSRPPRTQHARIKAQILQRIVDGDWRPGHQLPKETALAESFGVSRMTMNKVLTQLSAEGYVVRRKKSGTFVARPRSQSAVMEITSIGDEVAALGRAYRWQLTGRGIRRLTGAERNLLGQLMGDDDGVFLCISGLHHSDGVPFCHEFRVINPRNCPEALEQDFAGCAPGQWMLQTIPWSNASHTVRAVGAGDREAGTLGLRPGAPCLEILRQTQTASGWLTRVRLLYPGDAHQLFAQFEPRAPG